MKSWTIPTSLGLMVGVSAILVYFGNRISTVVTHGKHNVANQTAAPSQPPAPIVIYLPTPRTAPAESTPPIVVSGE